jgi:hypothetical protein
MSRIADYPRLDSLQDQRLEPEQPDQAQVLLDRRLQN